MRPLGVGGDSDFGIWGAIRPGAGATMPAKPHAGIVAVLPAPALVSSSDFALRYQVATPDHPLPTMYFWDGVVRGLIPIAKMEIV